jgi:hypothetical protein
MHSLRSVLASIQKSEQSEGVRELLSLLPLDEFGSYDAQIVSWGGVGSTELSNYLNRHGISTNLLQDGDGIRHANAPPSSYGDSEEASGPRIIIYLYGDPLTSIASHYRRGHAYHQALKTNGGVRLLERDFPKTFQAYVQRGEDLFGLQEHFNHWKTTEIKPPKNVCLVKYERVFEEEVCRPLFELICKGKKDPGLIALMVEEFCRGKRARESVVPVELRHMMYASLTEEMKSLPPLLVRDAKGNEIQQYGTFTAYQD